MKYLVAVDMEGVNYVVGEPYKSLHKGCGQYDVAVCEATKELNVIISALYDSGAEQVYVWDNHSVGHNLDFKNVDPRAKDVGLDNSAIERMNFTDSLEIDGVIFLGYHSKEGTLNGVLAHTYSSESIQYFKIANKAVGEFFIDSNIALFKNIPVLMLVSDDVCLREITDVSDDIVTVATKRAKGRNAADFRGEDLYKELYDKTIKALSEAKKMRYKKLVFPVSLEIRYTRTEKAAAVRQAVKAKYGIDCEFGEDCHILKTTAQKIEDIKVFL